MNFSRHDSTDVRAETRALRPAVIVDNLCAHRPRIVRRFVVSIDLSRYGSPIINIVAVVTLIVAMPRHIIIVFLFPHAMNGCEGLLTLDGVGTFPLR